MTDGSGRGSARWLLARDRASSSEGLMRVVDLSISSVMAAPEMKRRHPSTTLGRLPSRISA